MEYVSGGTATHGHAEGGTFVMEGGFQRTQDRLDRERAEEKLFQEQHPISHVDPELLRLKAEVAAKKLERLKAEGRPVPDDLNERIERTRADYERWLDARYAAARGHVDALIDPLEARRVLAFALEITMAHGHREHLVLETL